MSQRQPKPHENVTSLGQEAGHAADRIPPVTNLLAFSQPHEQEMTANTNLTIGDKASNTTVIDENMVRLFAQLTGDFNPIHLDPETGKKSIFGSNIVHGMLVGSLYGPIVVNQLIGPGCIYRKQSLEFEAPVPVGESVTSVVSVRDAIRKPDKVIYVMDTETFITESGKRVLKGEAVLMVMIPKDQQTE